MRESSLLDLLLALRDAPDRSASELRPAWRAVQRVLETCAGTQGGPLAADREEAISESLLKVLRSIDSLGAASEEEAQAWLRRVYERTHLDLIRKRRRRRELFDAERSDSSDEGLIARIPDSGHAPDAPPRHPDRLAPFEEELWNRVDEYLEARVRRHARANARRRAQIAYDHIVRGQSTEELLERLEHRVQLDTLYQWVHRGRDQVLIPTLQGWAAEEDTAEEARRFAEELLEILRSRIRRDAGKPRPQRRGGNG